MSVDKNLSFLVKNMHPKLNDGTYVFISVKGLAQINRNDTICEFKGIEHDNFIHLAERFGYYDQAHFNNEFKTYMGCTPLEFKNKMLEE